MDQQEGNRGDRGENQDTKQNKVARHVHMTNTIKKSITL